MFNEFIRQQGDEKTMEAIKNVDTLRNMGFEVEMNYEFGEFTVMLKGLTHGVSYTSHVYVLYKDNAITHVIRNMNEVLMRELLS